MRITTLTRGIAAGLGLLAIGSLAEAQVAPPPRAPQQPAQNTRQAAPNVTSGDLAKVGEIEELPSPADVQGMLKALFIAADMNGDGLISKKEATSAGDLLVGGFFFRADLNGDGSVTQQEAQQVRDEFLQQKPIMRLFVQEVRNSKDTTKQSPFKGLGDLLDSNNDATLQASEVRQSVQTAVDGFYAAADTNRDNQLSPGEMNAAAIGLARAASQIAFRQADADNNGAVSQAEFEKAIVEPARVVFKVIDANNDGQITDQEALRAQRYLASQMQLNVPDASDSNAPIPNFGFGAAVQPAEGGQPAPGTQPAPRR